MTINLLRTGPYLVKLIREGLSGARATRFFNLLHGTGVGNIGPVKTGKTSQDPPAVAPQPAADLIMISSNPTERGPFNANARACIPNHTPIDSVAAVNKAINDKFVANGSKKFTAALIDHGNVALIGMGGGDVAVPGHYIDPTTVADLDAFVLVCKIAYHDSPSTGVTSPARQTVLPFCKTSRAERIWWWPRRT